MSRYKGEGIFRRYKLLGHLRVLTGCLYCEGALFDTVGEIAGQNGSVMLRCFHCGRRYLSHDGGRHIRLWPYREFEHLDPKKKRGPDSNTYTEA